MENTTQNDAAYLAIRSLFAAYEAALHNDSQLFLTEVGNARALCPEQPLENILTSKLAPLKNTLLHAAVESGSENITSWLVQQCPVLIRMENRVRDTALHIAARAGNEAITKLLVDSNDDQNQTRNRRNIVPLLRMQMQNFRGNTALHEAVIKCNFNIVKWLISADPETTVIFNAEYKSPMYLAVESGAINLLSCLLEHCHQVAFNGRWRKSPMHAAIDLKRLDMLEEMITKMPQFSKQRSYEGLTPLQYASSRGNFGAIDLLLEKNAFGILDRCRGSYALHFASESGCLKSFKKLLKVRPYPSEFLNERLQNVLHTAASNGSYHIVRYILGELKLDKFANAKDIAGNTPLHLAAANGYYQVVGFLIFSGKSNPLIENNLGSTAFDIAIELAVSGKSEHLSNLIMTLSFLYAVNMHQSSRLPKGKVKREAIRMSQQEIKETANGLLVAAVLIAGVAFAGTIQTPGGNSIQGQDKMFHLRIYTFFNTFARNMSVFAAVMLCLLQMVEGSLRFYLVVNAGSLVGCWLLMGGVAFSSAVALSLDLKTHFANTVLLVESFFLFMSLLLVLSLLIPAGIRYPFARVLYLPAFFICYGTRRVVDFCLDTKHWLRNFISE